MSTLSLRVLGGCCSRVEMARRDKPRAKLTRLIVGSCCLIDERICPTDRAGPLSSGRGVAIRASGRGSAPVAQGPSPVRCLQPVLSRLGHLYGGMSQEIVFAQ